MSMTKLMINGDTVDATYCGKASEVEEMYDFSYYCKLDINNWRLHDYHDDDVSETAFADKFNEHFVHMLDTFDDVCNFKVKSIKKL